MDVATKCSNNALGWDGIERSKTIEPYVNFNSELNIEE